MCLDGPFSARVLCPALALPPLKTNYITIAVITFPDMTIPPCGGDITLRGSWIAHISIIMSSAHPAPSASHRLFLIGLNSQSSDAQFISRCNIQHSFNCQIHMLAVQNPISSLEQFWHLSTFLNFVLQMQKTKFHLEVFMVGVRERHVP